MLNKKKKNLNLNESINFSREDLFSTQRNLNEKSNEARIVRIENKRNAASRDCPTRFWKL